MEYPEFLEAVPKEADLQEVLKTIADTVRGGPMPKSFMTVAPTDPLWLAAAYTLWRLAKIGLDHVNALSEQQLAEQRIQIMQGIMKENGLGLKQSKDIVDQTIADISKRSADDPILQRTQVLLGSQKS